MEPTTPQKDHTHEIPSELQKTLEEELYRRSQRVTEKDEETILSQTPDKVQSLLNAAGKKVPYVRELVARVQLLYRLVRDKDYKLQWSSKSILLGALLYFISPFDFFPDFVPFVGYIDDAFVIGTVINTMAGEIERYTKLRNIPDTETDEEESES